MLSSQHSQSVEAMLTNVPGLKIVTAATPSDGYGLLKSAIRDNNPVVFLESEMMYGWKGELAAEEFLIPLGVGDIKRPGTQVTMVAWNKQIHKCLEACKVLADQGIDVELLDPRTLQPLDEELIFTSVRKTHRVVVVEESWSFASVGAQIADRVQLMCFDELDAPVTRVTSEFVPMPYNEHLEEHVLPSVERIVAAVKQVLYVE
jgi:pyruvate dehydrogenase E1 component beta subunit